MIVGMAIVYPRSSSMKVQIIYFSALIENRPLNQINNDFLNIANSRIETFAITCFTKEPHKVPEKLKSHQT